MRELTGRGMFSLKECGLQTLRQTITEPLEVSPGVRAMGKKVGVSLLRFFPKLLLKLALVYKGENVLALSKNEKTNLSSAQSAKLQDLVAFCFYEILLSKVKYNVSSRR